MKKYILLVLAIGGLVQPAVALNWVSKPATVQTGQTYTVSATHTFSGGGGVAAGSIYIYKNGAFFAGNGNGGNSFTMSTSASTSDTQDGTITYTSTATVTPQGWGSGPMTYNISGTVQVSSPNIPPTVGWHTLPGTMHPNTWYAARATGSDGNGNLGGVWVEFRVNGGSWQALAYDPVGANGGNGSATTTNNNGVTTGGAGTTYQFRCYAWDQASANSGWKESGVFTVVKRSQSSLTLHASSSQVFGTAQTLSTSGGSGSGGVSYAIVGQSASGVASLSGATLTANTGTGWVDVKATKGSDSNYNSKTSNTVRVTFAKAGQAITFNNPGNKTYGNASFSLGATASSSLGVSYSVSGPATLSGSTLTLTGAGSVTVTASQAGNANWNAAANVTRTFSVAPKPVSFSFSSTSHTYSGGAKAPTIGNPGGATYSITGTSSATNAGSYSFTVTATGNYTGSATCNWSIAKATQAALTFAPATLQTYNTSQTLSASGGTGGGGLTYAITNWSASGVATLSGATLTANTGTGWVEVQATRAADANYSARASSIVRVNFVKAGQATLSFSPATTQTYGTSQTLSASGGTGGGAVSYAIVAQSAAGVATLSGATLTANTGTGWVDVQATKAADSNYSAKTSSAVRVNFEKAGQAALTFSLATTLTYNTAQTLSASGGSGGGAISYAIVTQSATGAATLTGASLKANTGTGWVDVQATRAADTNYNAKTSSVVRVSFAKAAQTALAFAPATTQTYNTTQTLSATGGWGGGTISYAIVAQSAANVATLTGASLKANTGTGWVDVQATRAADANYSAKTSSPVRINFTKAEQTALNFSPSTPQIYSTSQTLAAAGGSTQGAVSYAISDESAPGVGTLIGDTLTANVGTGRVDVQATKAGDSNYNDKTSTATVTFARKPVNFTFSNTEFEWSGTYDAEGNPHGDTKEPTINNPSGATFDVVLDPSDPKSARSANTGGNYYFDVTATGNFVDESGPARCEWLILCCPAEIDVDETTLMQVYNGQPKEIIITTSPRDLSVSFTYQKETSPGVLGSPLAGMPTNAGRYQINISVYDADPEETGGYGGQSSAILQISPAPLTVTANDATRHYGAENPGFTATITGFVNGENASVLSGEPAFTTPATLSSPVEADPYPIIPSQGTLLADNYAFTTFVNGNLTITPRPVETAIAVAPVTEPFYNPAAQSLAVSATVTGTPNPTEGLVTFVLNRADGFVLAVSDEQAINPANATAAAVLSIPGGTPAGSGYYVTAVYAATTAGNYTWLASSANGAASSIRKALPEILWDTPAPITYGTPLSGVQLNASEASGLEGSMVYTPGEGAVVDAGLKTLLATFTPADTDNYEIATKTVTLSVEKAQQAPLVLHATSPQTLGVPQTLSATGGTGGGALTYSIIAQSAVDAASLVGDILTPNTGTGWVDVKATRAGGTNYHDVHSDPVRVNFAQATATVTLGSLTHTYDGFPKTASAATMPSGRPVTITYGEGNRTDVGSYEVSAVIADSDPDYTGSASGELVIQPAPQTVSISATPSSVAFGQSVTFTATGGHNGYVWGGAAAGSDGSSVTVTPTAAGTVAVTAYSPVGGNYQESNVATAEAIVTRVIPVGTFAGKTVNGPYKLTAEDLQATFAHPTNAEMPAPTGAITYEPVAGAVLNGGTHTITASYPGDNNYAQTKVTATFVVNRSTPEIIWNPMPLRYGETYGESQRGAVAKVGSQTIPGTFTYTPAPGSVATTIGTKELTVHFTPSDSANYNAAVAARTITIGKGVQTITFANPGDKQYGEFMVLTATSNSGLPIGYNVSGQAQKVAAMSNGTGKALRTNGIGTVTVTAVQQGNDYYDPAPSVTHQFNVTKALHTITFPDPATTGYALLASSSAGIPVTYDLSDETGGWVIRDVDPIDPNLPSFKQLAFTGYLPNKTVQVIATAGDEFHETVTVTSPMFSSSGSDSFWITRPADTVVAAEGYHLSFYAHHEVSADTSQNTFLKMYARRSDASTWTELGSGYFNSHGIVNTGVFIATAGTWEIKVVNGPDANSAEYSNHRLTITAINGQVINFPDPGPRKVNEVFNLGASTTAVGLPISYHVIAATPGSVEFVTTSSIRVTQPGPVTIEARQGGGSGYAPALSVQRTFTVVAPPRLVIEQPLTYSTATGILSAQGYALDYEDGAPIAVTLVIDGQPQGPQVVQRKDRSDIAAQAVAGNWSLKSVFNCGWEIDFPVASLAEGSHTVFIRATDGSEQSVELGHTNFTGGTPQERSETITFPDIGPRSFGEQFMLSASAASGRLVTYTVDSGGHLITLEGNRVTVKNTAGSVTIRASTPGGGGYPPASVERTFSIAHGDEDGDGIPEWWEQAYGINASPGSDANNDGVKDIDEYHLWRNPKQLGGGQPKDIVPADLTVTAKTNGANGTVTLTINGTPHTFTFTGPAGQWLEPSPFGTHTYAKVGTKLGEEIEVSVSSSGGVSDYIIKAVKSPIPASELRSRIDLSAPGGDPIQFADAISKAELAGAGGGNKIKVRATVEGSLPFGVMDTSKLEVQRRVRFGLGGTRSGDAAGMIVYSSDNYVLGGGIMNFAVVKGPAMTDVREHISDPKRFQAKVPAGYVDVNRRHDLITIRFYADGTYPDDGPFKNFASATPLVSYSLAGGLMEKTGSITQTTGGNALMLEFENERSVSESTFAGENGIYTRKRDYTSIFRHWGWRSIGAPREGLTTVKSETFQLTTVGADNNPGNPTRQPTFVRIFRHQGPASTDGVLSQEEHQFGVGDTELHYGASAVLRGSAADQQIVSHRYTESPSNLLSPPTIEVNSTGGKIETEYFTSSRQIGGGSNFDGLPDFLAGERKTVSRGFLDGAPEHADAIVTSYTYKNHLVDGRAVPATAVTKQGATTIGDIVYDYPAASTGQVITKTSVRPANAATPLDTTLRAYSRRIADLERRDKPISVTAPDGTRTVYSYRISGPNLIITELNGKAGGGVTQFENDTLLESLDMDANRSTVTKRTFDRNGRLTREESYVYQGGTTFTSLGAVDHTYDDLGNLTAKTHSSGRVLYEASYDGFRKVSETDEQGVTLTYTYDDYNRVKTMTRASASDGANSIAATTTTYEYDQAGRLVKETVSATGTTETLVSSYTYDTANRPKTRTLPGNFKTTITYDSATKTTTTLPDGGTKIEEVHKDGRVKSVTGTAVPDTTTTYAYDVTSGNLKTTQTTAGQWATTETDWAGRTVSVSTPTFAGTTRVVSSTYTGALLTKQETKVGSTAIALPRIFKYDDDGYARLVREGLDANGNGVLEPATDYDVKEYEFTFQTGAPNYSTNLYRYEGVKIWPHDGTNASISRFASQTYTQVTGLESTTMAHAISRDFDQNVTDSTTIVDRANKKVTVSTTTTGTTATLQQVTLNGLPIKSVNAQGHVTLQTYDALGRLQATDDPRMGPTDHEYYANTTLLKWTTTPDNRTTQYAYDAAGRAKSQTNPDGKIAYFQYDAAGNLTHQWGETVNPAKYLYNDLGQKTEMHTYRSGTWTGATRPTGFNSDGDKTTWTYQATTGLLLSKKDAANATMSFEYTALGQMAKRTDARGWITLYEYTDARKLLTKVDYTGTAETYTTDVAYSYDRSGRTSTVSDALGQRSFGYYDEATGAGTQGASGRLKSESLPSFGNHTLMYTYQYGTAGRVNGALKGLELNTSVYVSYGYDGVLRPNSVAYAGDTAFTYTYVANSNLIDQVTQGAGGYLRDYDYLSDSNRLDKLKHAWGSDTAKKVETIVSYNSLGLRNTEKTSGSDYMATLGRGSETGVHTDYTYTDRMELDDSGKYALLAGGALGGLRNGTVRNYDYDAIGNRTADHVGLYTPNSLNQYTAAPGFGAFSYDANGNLRGDGVRTYDYDAENRLIKVTQDTAVWNYKYDYLGRRVEKSGTGITTTRFLYDGWNVIAELNDENTIQRRFAWGLDVSGSLQGAGGVGGLLVIDDGVARRYPIYDASHNVIALYTSTGTLAAAYEYDPFGNTSTSLGSYAAQNPFRYSTKYTDAETNFVYYGHRYYVPALGRFLNRDPIEEVGGLNLYGFCGNDGVNSYDYLGMNSQEDNKSFAEEAERAAHEAAMHRARGEIIAKYGITGFAFGEGRNDQDVMNAYVDGYNGFVDTFNDSVRSRGGADGSFGTSSFGGGGEVGSTELRANGAVTNGAAVGLTQEQRNLAKTATVTLGDLVSLGTVGDDAISSRMPTRSSGLAPLMYDDYLNSSWGRTPGQSDWEAVVGAGRDTFGNAVFQQPLTTLATAGAQATALVGTVYAGTAAAAPAVVWFGGLSTEAKIIVLGTALRVTTHGDIKAPPTGRVGGGAFTQMRPAITRVLQQFTKKERRGPGPDPIP